MSTERELASARLLTLESFGHTAFFQSACVVTAVERYLIAKALPSRGAVCQPDRGPFDPVPEPTAQEEALDEALAPLTVPVARPQGAETRCSAASRTHGSVSADSAVLAA